MELAATVLSMIGSAAASGAGAIASAGSSLIAALPGLGGAGATAAGLSSLQGVGTVAQAVTSILGGAGGLMTGLNNARMTDINARSEGLASEAQAVAIERDLVKKIGANRVGYAAAGLDISSGGDIEEALRDQARHQTVMAETSGQMAAAGRRGQAASQRVGGYMSLVEGLGKAAGAVGKYKLDIAKRG